MKHRETRQSERVNRTSQGSELTSSDKIDEQLNSEWEETEGSGTENILEEIITENFQIWSQLLTYSSKNLNKCQMYDTLWKLYQDPS